ncbi:restriction endonuclease subunit S [Clostridium magnum]|uniref:EcoKI restriction-modification system protein HsdS n=1 Tax=Clostridium magnum DSM 2767 TaxID=1121326 RepID=A0A161Y441_9CLOT|nr:restriction endonuclease subunit S [Clostridium magnum]KZL92879.1 EcoKI restriction-modification system protein HsdS [Clostridium magnum DSM 2767]SHI28170.1 Type I restriction modification DNA specificity domain-containing protein [Clostridium magnum DSM 2767]
MSENKKNVPKRRFKEFENAGDWEQCKLKDVSTYSNGGSFENDVQEKGRYELITLKSVDIGGNLVHSGRYVDVEVPTLTKGTLVMILSEQSPGLLGMTTQIPIDNTYILNQRVAEIRPYQSVDSYFLSKAINKNQQYFSRCGAGTKVQNISKSNVENYEFLFPLLQEQQKIGQFFTNIDNLITLHQRKLEKMKALKKAYFTDMFPAEGECKPKLRFAGFTGDWEQRKFSELFTTLQNNALSRAELNSEKGVAMNVHYGDVLIKFRERLDVSKEEVPFIIDDTCVSKYKSSFLNNGDVIIADAAEDETVGKCSEIVGLTTQTVISGLHTIPCRPMQVFASGYLGYYMNSNAYHDQLLPLIQGTKVSSISKSALNDTVIIYPKSKEEQTLIAKYFINLDKLITLHHRKLEKLQNIKKAYLNEMFI